MGLVNQVDFSLEVLEVAFLHPDLVPRLERNSRLDLGSFILDGLAGAENPLHVLGVHRRRFAAGPGEVADAGCFADDEPGLVVDRHVDQDIAGVNLPLHHAAFAGLGELGHVLGGDDDFLEVAVQPFHLHLPHQGILDPILAVHLHLEDEPLVFQVADAGGFVDEFERLGEGEVRFGLFLDFLLGLFDCRSSSPVHRGIGPLGDGIGRGEVGFAHYGGSRGERRRGGRLGRRSPGCFPGKVRAFWLDGHASDLLKLDRLFGNDVIQARSYAGTMPSHHNT